MTHTEQLIAALERLDKAATPGPWRWGWQHGGGWHPEGYVVIESHEGFANDDFLPDWRIALTHRFKHGHENAVTIAALRNALPALVELVKHYKAAVEFLGYTGEADEDAARVLAALGGGDE